MCCKSISRDRSAHSCHLAEVAICQWCPSCGSVCLRQPFACRAPSVWGDHWCEADVCWGSPHMVGICPKQPFPQGSSCVVAMRWLFASCAEAIFWRWLRYWFHPWGDSVSWRLWPGLTDRKTVLPPSENRKLVTAKRWPGQQEASLCCSLTYHICKQKTALEEHPQGRPGLEWLILGNHEAS